MSVINVNVHAEECFKKCKNRHKIGQENETQLLSFSVMICVAGLILIESCGLF